MNGKGTYRTRGVGDLPNTARVVDKSVAFDLPELQYRSRGYKPEFDELDWMNADFGGLASDERGNVAVRRR